MEDKNIEQTLKGTKTKRSKDVNENTSHDQTVEQHKITNPKF